MEWGVPHPSVSIAPVGPGRIGPGRPGATAAGPPGRATGHFSDAIPAVLAAALAHRAEPIEDPSVADVVRFDCERLADA